MAEPAKIAVIYYSATGNVHGLAQAVATGAEDAGAEVRLRHVEELASELLISQNQYWGRHRSQVAEAPVATLEAGGNPYGAWFVTGHTVTGSDEHAVAVARYQGRRLARFTGVLAEARRKGIFAVERPSPESFAGSTRI